MNRQEIEKIYYDWEKELEKEYNEIFSDAQYTIFDGVVSPFDYFQSPIKVMFLNREAYDKNSDSYSINEALKKEIEQNKTIFGGTYWVNQNTKERLAYCSFIDRTYCLDDNNAIFEAQNLDDKEYRSLLYKSAYCNIKKSDGKERSSKNDLLNYAQKGWTIIEKQVAFFNPTLIIAGNVIDGIIANIEGVKWGEPRILFQTPKIVVYQIEFAGKSYPFIDMYHPSSTKHSEDLFFALRFCAQKYPGLWESRTGQKCFNL